MRTDRLLLWFTRRFGAPNDLLHPVDMNNTTRRRKERKKKTRRRKEGNKHSTLVALSPLHMECFFLCLGWRGQMLRRCLFRSANMCPLSLSLWEWNVKGKPSSRCFDSLYGMHIWERARVSLWFSQTMRFSRNVLSTAVAPASFERYEKKNEGKMAISKYYNSIWFIFRQQCFLFFRERNKNPVGQFSHESAITLCGFSSLLLTHRFFPSLYGWRKENKHGCAILSNFWTHFLDQPPTTARDRK